MGSGVEMAGARGESGYQRISSGDQNVGCLFLKVGRGSQKVGSFVELIKSGVAVIKWVVGFSLRGARGEGSGHQRVSSGDQNVGYLSLKVWSGAQKVGSVVGPRKSGMGLRTWAFFFSGEWG